MVVLHCSPDGPNSIWRCSREGLGACSAAHFWERRDEVGPGRFNPFLWGGACRWLEAPLLSLVVVVGKPETVGLLGSLPLILSFQRAKKWGPFPQNDYPERTGDTAMHPQLSGTSMLRCGAGPSAGHACWICSFPSLSSRPVSIQGRADLGFGPSTWWMLKPPSLRVKPCLVSMPL